MEELTAAVVRNHGTIHHVVAGLGKWWSGKPALQVEEAEFDRYFACVSRLYFAAATALVPHIPKGGSYRFLAGLSAVLPLPGVSLVGMPDVPFGGFKQFGIGREYGVFGLQAYLEPKAVQLVAA